MEKNTPAAPPVEATLNEEGLSSPSVSTQDKTEPLSVSQASSAPVTQASVSQSQAPQSASMQVPQTQTEISQAPLPSSASQLHETLMPVEEQAPTQARSQQVTDLSPSTPEQTLAPPTEGGISADRQSSASASEPLLATPVTSAGESGHAGSSSHAPTRPATHQFPLTAHHFPPVTGYTISKELGRGGMGVVYKAIQGGLNRTVALKMILSGRGSQRERERFRLEAEVIARLQHPNIVQIYEIGEHHESLYFSLEFVERGSLTDLLGKERPTPAQAARIVHDLALGMDLAHSQGIVHRDLKPANVLMGGKPGMPLDKLIPKITDFGLAMLVEDQDAHKHHSGGVMGTPSYMPPEQAQGRHHQVGPPADIYALGAVLYDLLAGRPPFRGTTVVETLKLVCSARPRPPVEFNPAIPLDLQIICLKCLEKEPQNRYGSARELAADLKAFLDGAPISARTYSKWERARKWVRRRPAAAALLLVSVLSLLGVASGGAIIARQQSALAKEEKEHAEKESALRRTAEQEWKRAEDNLKEANSAVAILTDIGHRRLSSVPYVENIRRELLEKALAFNEHFVAINGDRPGQRREVGRSYLRAAEIQEKLGRQKEAVKSYQKALDLFTVLLAEAPGNEDYRRDLAVTWNDQAILQAAMNQQDAAEKSFAEAIALKTGLAAEAAGSDAKLVLAKSYVSRGQTRLAHQKSKEAEADYQQALALLADLPREQCLEDVARLHNSLGALCWKEQQPARAREFYTRSIEGWRTLMKKSSDPQFRYELGMAYTNRGVVESSQSKPKEAEADYQEATRLLVKLTSEFRRVVDYRQQLADVYFNYGRLLRELGRHQDGVPVWRAALPLYRGLAEDLPGQRDYRQKLGQTYNELAGALASTNHFEEVGKLWTDAIIVQEQLVSEEPSNGEYWQDLTDSHTNLTSLFSALAKWTEAETSARRLVAVEQRRLEAFPKVAAYRSDLARCERMLAQALLARNKGAEARGVLESAVRHARETLEASRANLAYRQALCEHAVALIELLLKQSDHAAASAALRELLATVPPVRKGSGLVSPEQAAGFLARCVALVEKDMKLEEPKRKELQQAYGDEAMKLLRQAVSQGYRQAEVLKTSRDLAALRQREDFQQLIRQLSE